MNYLQSLITTISTSKLGQFTTKNAPQILIGIGVVSSVGTVATSIVATKRSLDIINTEIEKRRSNLEKSTDGELPKINLKPMEIVKLTWKEWVIPAGFLAGSTAAYVGAFKVEEGRALTYATLLGATESKLAALEAEMVENLGKEKSEEIHDAVAKKLVDEKKIGADPEENAAVQGDGKFWCYEPISEEKWRVTYDRLQLGLMNAKEIFERRGRISLGDILEECGNKKHHKSFVYGLVWNYRRGEEDDDDVSYSDRLGITITSTLTENQEPCYVFDYNSYCTPSWDKDYSTDYPFR